MRMPESPLQGRPPFDDLLVQITDYVAGARIEGHEAHQTARYCLMDTLGCALLALRDPACTKLLGPVVPGTIVPQGSRVPGTKLAISMTPGWLRNGGTPPTTWVLFSRRQIMSAAKKWLKDSGLTSCTTCCRP